MGRPRKAISAEQVERLARIGCTEAEIADILGSSQQTISRRFRVQIARARGLLKMSLRRAQYRRAVKDRSDAMLIHLGKVFLSQGAGGDGDPARRALLELLADDADPPGTAEVPG